LRVTVEPRPAERRVSVIAARRDAGSPGLPRRGPRMPGPYGRRREDGRRSGIGALALELSR